MKAVAAIAVLISLAASSALANAEALPWGDDLEQALQRAAKEQKPVLVEFSAAWNPWCQALWEKTYPDESIQDLMGRYIRVRVDAEKHPELKKRFGIKAVPTLVILDATKGGAEIRRANGFQTIVQLAQELSKGLLGDGTALTPDGAAPAAGQSDPENPLPGMAQEMKKARDRLDSEDTSRGTQDIQQKLLSQLDEMIKQAQQASSSSPSPSPSPGDPKPGDQPGPPQNSDKPGPGGGPEGAPSSSNASRDGTRNKFNPVDEKAKEWGNLPPQERAKILQELRENYPPEYVDDIEKYFKQLSEGGR